MTHLNEQQKALLAIAIVFIVYLLGSYLYYGVFQGIRIHPTGIGECDLAKAPCTVAIGNNGNVTLAVTPKGIPTKQILTFTVTTQQNQPQSISLDLVNIHIPNCHQLLSLTPQGKNTFTISTTLPECPTPTENWMAMVRVQLGPMLYAIPFHFSPE